MAEVEIDGRIHVIKKRPWERTRVRKGKNAYVRELETLLPKLIATTEASELDAHINAMTKAKQPALVKR